MRRNVKKMIIGIVVLISFFLSSTIITAAEPVLESFTIDPEEPAPLSDITVTADIGGEVISAVVVHIKECNQDQCVTSDGKQSSSLSGTEWEDDATYTVIPETELEILELNID